MKRLLSGFRRLGIKLKKRRQRVSLRRQIFAALFLVTLCVTGTVGELAYGFARNKIEENYQKSHAANLNNTSKVLDLLIQNLIVLREKSRGGRGTAVQPGKGGCPASDCQ